jgi:hypothetical protein
MEMRFRSAPSGARTLFAMGAAARPPAFEKEPGALARESPRTGQPRPETRGGARTARAGLKPPLLRHGQTNLADDHMIEETNFNACQRVSQPNRHLAISLAGCAVA